MQNLLEDPVFYNLLVNNNESIRSSSVSSSETSVAPKPQFDYNFLKLSFPLATAQSQTITQRPSQPLNQLNHSTSSETESSYQSSIFSNDQNTKAQLDDSFVDSIDDFFNKELSLQLNSEFNQLKQPEIQQKQFHKFYSSPIYPLPSRITKQSTQAIPSYHKCPFCLRQFKNKSYLVRHLKKHDTVKDFKCPFFNEEHSKCHHLNGEFSRKDTYKAHLKSIHFIYPVGVAKSQRGGSQGRCASCFKEYSNNNEWIKEHIENNECPVLAYKRY